MSAKQATPAAGKTHGFTLVELLVVVGIIALLISMLLPTFGRAKLIAQNTRARGWLAELGNACIAYQRETGFYPGQADQRYLVGNHTTSGCVCGLSGNDTSKHFTGSQYLGMILFGQGVYNTASNQVTFPCPYAATSGKWAAYHQNDILTDAKYRSPNATIGTYVVNPANGQQVSANVKPTPFAGYISDRMNAPLPFLYFVSRPGMNGMNQYRFNDNTTGSDTDKNHPVPPILPTTYDPYQEGRPALEAETGVARTDDEKRIFGNDEAGKVFNGFITDTRSTNATMTPRNPGGFILIGAGMDRKFFTDDDLIFPAWGKG